MYKNDFPFSIEDFRSTPLPTESEIMDEWKGDIDKPVVSVILVTYNHEQYVEDALRGFLLQQTDFPFEIVVHDDASTDGTVEIIKNFVAEYPGLFKLVVQKRNQFSQGRKPLPFALRYARGEFVALCEGDDFWIDRNKIKVQKESIGTSDFSASLKIDYFSDGKFSYPSKQCGEIAKFDIEDVVNVSGKYAPTASYFFRRKIFDQIPSFYAEAPVGDVFIELQGVARAAGVLILRPMVVYRVSSEGSWTKSSLSFNDAKVENIYERMISCYDKFSELYPGVKINFDRKKSFHADVTANYFLSRKRFTLYRHYIELSYMWDPYSNMGKFVRYHTRMMPRTYIFLRDFYRYIKRFFSLT